MRPLARATVAPLCAILLTLAGATQAQQWPARPIRVISPYPPGGSVTAATRLVTDELAKRLGQPFVVENRGGGSTSIGTEAVVRAAPDGYTLLGAAVTLVLYPHMIPTPYDILTGLAPVQTIGAGDLLLVVHPALPAQTLQDLINLAKARPSGALNYATSGAGGLTHLAMEQLGDLSGVKFTHIPYKGAGPATLDLLGGQVHMAFQTPAAVLQHVQAGKLRALGYSGPKRFPALPQVPTFGEQGVANFNPRTWYGLLATGGTPRPIVERLADETARVLALPEVVAGLGKAGIDPLVIGPDKFSELIKTDYERYGRIIKAGNIKLD